MDTSTDISFNPSMTIVWFIFYLYVLNWLIRIDKCKCTNIPEGKNLKEWFTFFIIFEFVWFFVYLIILAYNQLEYMYIMVFLLFLLGIVNIIYMIKTIIYITKLKENKCKCGSELELNLIYSVLIINFSFILLGMLLTLIFFITNYAFSK